MWRAGYTNVDCFPGENQIRGTLTDLDWLVDNGEATEIIAYNVIDHYYYTFLGDIIAHWVSKLALGGTLTIVGTDLYRVVSKIASRELTVEQANLEIYGIGAGSHKTSTSSMLDVCNRLRGHGLKIIEQRYEDSVYVVKGRRK